MKSILPHNENPIFVTFKNEDLVAVWSWDDGNELDLGSSIMHGPESIKKWKNFDKLIRKQGDDVDDVKYWEFYHCLVEPGPYQEEKKEEEEGEAQEDEEKTKSKNPLHLPKIFSKDNRIKSMIVDSKNMIVDSTNVVVDTAVEHLNPIRMFGQHHKRSASQTRIDDMKRSSSQRDVMTPEDRKDFVGQAVEDALLRAKNTFTLKQNNKKYDALEDNGDNNINNINDNGEEGSTKTTEGEVKNMSPDLGVGALKKKEVQESPPGRGGGVNAFKDQYGSVMDIVFTNPIALAKAKAFKAKTPQTERKVVKKDMKPPPIPEDTLSPQVTRKALGNFMSDPINKSAVRKKKASKRSKLQKALAASHLLRPPHEDDDSNNADDRSVTSTRSYTRPKKNKEGRRRRSSSVGAVEDDSSVAGKSRKSKSSKNNKDNKRSNSKSRKSKQLRRAESSRNVDGERQSDDEDDMSLILTPTRSSSSRSLKSSKKSSRRVPKQRRSEVDNMDDLLLSPESKRKSKKKQLKKLEALNRQMKKTMGLNASSSNIDNSDNNSVKSGRSLDERRARKRESQAKLKKTFDKIVVDKAMDATKNAMDVTKGVGKVGKAVGKGAMDVTVGVTKGAMGATKTVGKGAMDVTKTVGKGALDVTKTMGKGMGKAIGVTTTKSTSTTSPTPATAATPEATRTE